MLKIETIIFFILVALGAWLIKHPLVDDKGASATLVGALWGGAAILIGNGLNRYYARSGEKAELEKSKTTFARS